MSLEKKIIKDTVRITMSKFVKIGEYIMAKTTPGWNRPEATAGDYDTLAPEVVSSVYKKYDSQIPTYSTL